MQTSPPDNSNLSMVVFTADRWEHVCPTIRVLSPARQAGLRLIRGNDWEGNSLHIYPERVSEAEIILIQRNFPGYVEEYETIVSLAHEQGKAIIYELDDLLAELPQEHPDYFAYVTPRASILRALVEADAVIGSTRALCDYASTFNPNTRIIHNYLDDHFWKLAPGPGAANRPLTIGYMGGHSHSYDLEILAPVLPRVLDRYKDRIALKFWGVAPPSTIRNHPNVDWVNPGIVDYGKFAAYFVNQRCDIFLAPLRDNLFNRCKSHLKFLEYSALCVPGVYSQITPYEAIVEHGENGFLASTAEQWEECIARLIEDAELRLRMGRNAQASVREGWMLSDHIDDWLQTYMGLAHLQEWRQKPQTAIHVAQKMVYWQNDLARDLAEQANSSKQEQRDLQARLIEKERLIAEKDGRIEALQKQYTELVSSRSWKLMEKLIRARLKLIPKDSPREHILKWSLRAPFVLFRGGPSAFIRSTRNLRRALSALHKAAPAAPNPISVTLCEGMHFDWPAISVVIVQDGDSAPLDAASVIDWLNKQTYPSAANIVLWDRGAGTAWLADHTEANWEARDTKSLLQGLDARYICVASEDLLRQSATYLETNLMILEAEALAFSVNVCGNADWAIKEIRQGFLPGDAGHLLLRQVVHKDYLGESLEVDLSHWKNKQPGFPEVVGKILRHTTNDHDQEGSIPFKLQIGGANCRLLDKSILLQSGDELPLETIAQAMHPIDTVLPLSPEKSEKPTVIMVMPFLAVGGAEQIHLKVMQNLQDQVRFAVVTFDEHNPELGTTADAYRQITPFVYTLPDYMHPALYLSFMIHLIERLAPETIYIANGTNWIYNALGDIKKRYPGIRVVDQVYDSIIGWINRYDISVVMYTDGCIGVNSKICQAYVEKGVEPEKTYLIENGIDPKELDPSSYTTQKINLVKDKLGLPKDKKIVTFASRIHQQKRPMDFVELARRFALVDTVAFLMVGDGPLAATIDEQIRKIDLKNIHRQQFYRPISDILAVTDVLVLPSEFEGMPMIIIETQAMGKPVVVTDVGNNKEIIERTGGGVVVSRISDISALMEGVNKMLAEPPDPNELREKTLAHFDIAVVAQKYWQALIGDKRNA